MVEQTFQGSNINFVKSHNLQAILLSLLYDQRLSRVQLAHKTSLSTTTITNLIAELIDQGIVTEEWDQNPEEPQPFKQRSVGRPRTDLRLDSTARFAVGVHIEVGCYHVAAVDLFAEIRYDEQKYFNQGSDPQDILSAISASIETVIAESRLNRRRLLGVGVAACGLVDFQTGAVLFAPNLGWHNVPVQQILQDHLDLPVIVDNTVHAMALGEAFFGAGHGAGTLALIYGRTEVGAGFVIGGTVFRGCNGGAGEIGHTIIIPHDGELCRCGKRGCLETLVSEDAILREAEEIVRRNPNGLLAQYLDRDGELEPIEKVFNAARQGDLETRQLIEGRAFYLGIALANLVNLLNPELILLGGMFAQGHDLILPVATRTMREMAFAGLGEKVRVQTTGFGRQAGVIGASALALMRFFYQQSQVTSKI